MMTNLLPRCLLTRIFSTIVLAWLGKCQSLDADKLAPQIVSSSTAMYNTITRELLPTPAKSHYTFNLRDLSKVFQGMLMAQPNRIKVGTGLNSGLYIWNIMCNCKFSYAIKTGYIALLHRAPALQQRNT